MKYSIKVNEVRAKEGSNIKGFATVVFGDSFKITNIAILENKDKGELFVSMPRKLVTMLNCRQVYFSATPTTLRTRNRLLVIMLVLDRE